MTVVDMDERNRMIGENVRKYRLVKGITQDQLAENICSVSQLSKVENGKTYIKRTLLKEIAERLGVTVKQLETADAMWGEFKENIVIAQQLVGAGQAERALEMVRDAMAQCRVHGYLDLVVDALVLEAYVVLYVRREFQACIELLEAALREGLSMKSGQRVALYLHLGQAYQWADNRVVAYQYYCMADDEFQAQPDEQGHLLSFNLLRAQQAVNC